MAEEVERLVLAPFREIVEKGKTAIENVESADDQAPAGMLKAAQNLVKEGERALKKIEPLSTATYEEYGSNFIDAIKDNDDIAQFRSDLEDLLWDFDDYVEVDEFDADKFDDLQKASRKAAPKIWDILKRMRLVAPAPALITPPLEVQSPTSLTTHVIPGNIERPASQQDGQASDTVSSGAGPDSGIGNNAEVPKPPPRSNLRHSGPSDPPSEPPPTPPSANPWQIGRPPTTLGSHPEEGDGLQRRPPIAPDSPTIPRTQLVSPTGDPLSLSQARGSDDNDVHDEHERRMRATSHSNALNGEGSSSPLQSRRWANSPPGSLDATRPPPPRSHNGFTHQGRVYSQDNDHDTLHVQDHQPAISRISSGSSLTAMENPSSSRTDNHSFDYSGHNQGTNLAVFPLRTTSVENQNSSSYIFSSRKPSTESINSSVFDVVESLSPTGAGSSTHRHSTQPTAPTTTTAYQPAAFPPPRYPGPPPMYQTPSEPQRRPSGVTTRSQSSGGRTVHPGMTGTRGMDEGLIPVDMENSMSNELLMPTRDPDCSITPSSSFYKLKGFCKGAEEAQRGQLGFKRIKRPMGGFSTAIVAKCNHCLFELDFKLVEQDLNNESSGSFTSNSVGFRLRVLRKSHLPIRMIDEQLYGCLFCIQAGHTLDESDATVFFNQRQLFAHMARHPRPLPRISGVTVIEEPELPPNVKDNFDLHFPHPPTESVMSGISREVSRLPAAITTDTRKLSHGTMRLPPDRLPVLHYAIGARIVGIEFPTKYEGKWAIGWHDGVRAAFEVDTVQLDAPSKGEVRMQGTSSVQAVARWKWNQKGDDRWLRFEKGDMIKNISWVYADHWCWSGMNSKGQSGVFPQSHLDSTTLRLNEAGDDARSVSSWEKKYPLKFSIRSTKKEDRETRKLGSTLSTASGDNNGHGRNSWRSNAFS